MELTNIGGGVMVALAAALWLVYLVPNWFKKREYLATERNAVRLQQTIRVLAQTAEIPDEVRAEEVARRAAELAKAQAKSGPVAVGRVATPPTREEIVALSARRLRRTRAFTGLVLLTSIAVIVANFAVAIASGAALTTGNWLVVVGAAVAGVSASAMLSRLAERARAHHAASVPVVRAATPRRRVVLSSDAPVENVTSKVSWTPVPVPKPMYLSRENASTAPAAAAAAVRNAAQIANELRTAAENSEQALRAGAAAKAVASREVEVAGQKQEDAASVEEVAAPTEASAPSRFARMGIVEESGTVLDLDAALARRRAS